MTDQTLADVEIRRQEPEDLTRAYGLELKMLQPWAGLVAPFRGAWCVLRPGDESLSHAHHDREIFIVMSGRAEVVCGDQRYAVAAGDLALLKPGVRHRVINGYDEDFSYYAIWWDRAMSGEFLAHEAQSGPEWTDEDQTA